MLSNEQRSKQLIELLKKTYILKYKLERRIISQLDPAKKVELELELKKINRDISNWEHELEYLKNQTVLGSNSSVPNQTLERQPSGIKLNMTILLITILAILIILAIFFVMKSNNSASLAITTQLFDTPAVVTTQVSSTTPPITTQSSTITPIFTTQPSYTIAAVTTQPSITTATTQPSIATFTINSKINIDNIEKAFGFLFDRLKQDKVYSDGLECLSFMEGAQGKNYFDIALRERHGGTCPGDPNTAPVRDRFRVYVSGDIFWLNYITGEEVPYSDFKKS
jgi:hypothetical protein